MMQPFKETAAGATQQPKKAATHSYYGGSGYSNHEHSHADSAKGYQCPMKCEGNKIYHTSGNCFVCNMYLAPVR